MWFIELLSAAVGPTVANYVQTVLTCILGFFILLFAMLWLFTQPVLLVIVIAVLILIAVGCSSSK